MQPEADNETITRLYYPDVFRYAYSILGNSEEASDAAQEVFLKLVLHRDSFRQECSLKSWLLILTRNYCYNRRQQKDYNAASPEETALVGNPESDLAQKLTLEAALKQLAPEANELLYLREVLGHSYQEIASITSQSLENVKIKLFRTRQQLRKLLRQ